MLIPEVASPEDVVAIKAQIEQLDQTTLAERTDRLLAVVNAHQEIRTHLERGFLAAQDELSASRLSDVLNGTNGDSIRAAEDLAKDAVVVVVV